LMGTASAPVALLRDVDHRHNEKNIPIRDILSRIILTNIYLSSNILLR
jgi:hypothetical protein